MHKISHRASPQHGFSLVEIMVGLVIGMLAMVIMMQIFSVSEDRKRNASGGGDAQSSGVIAFYQLQRDIAAAGYGFAATGLFSCNILWPAATTATALVPVQINPAAIPAGDANTDTLLLAFGNTNEQPQGNIITATAASIYTIEVKNVLSYANNDRVIAAPGTCTTNLLLDTITATPASTATALSAQNGFIGATTLYNMGPAPTVAAYAIRKGNLTRCDLLVNDCTAAANTSSAAVWVPIANDIVSLRALYARDTATPMTGIPSLPGDQTTPTNACGWVRVSGINLVLVARNSQYDKGTKDADGTLHLPTNTARNSPDPVNAPTWLGASAASITLGADTVADEMWKHYRYRVFQAMVPVRNVAWMGVPEGC